MVDPFLQSVFVQPRAVLGRKLRPFSAFHAAALTLLDSPFWRGGTPDRSELIIAAYVCTLTFPHGAAALFPELQQDKVLEFGKKCTGADFEAECTAFLDHILDYMHTPEEWTKKDSDGGKSGVPGPFLIVSIVLQHMSGITETEAWNMPFSRLVGYKTAIAESFGAKVVSEQDRKDIAEVARINAEAAKKQEAQDGNS